MLKSTTLSRKTLSAILAAVLLLLLILWLWSGESRSSQVQAPAPSASPDTSTPFRVETRWLEAEPFQPVLTLQGQLQPSQQVEVRAETGGRVQSLLTREGQQIQQGTTLLQLAEDTRPVRLQQLQAERDTRAAELRAAERLRDANLLSETDRMRLISSLKQIETDIAVTELDLAHTRPIAPFDGLLEQRHVELGEFIQPGQPLFTLIQINPLKAVAHVPQQRVKGVVPGQQVTLELLDGRQFQGRVSHLGSLADPATRTFRLEATFDNPEQQRLAGASASLHIRQAATTAHFISLALLSLDERGQPGIKHVDEHHRVVFSPVQLLSSNTQGAWVAGLPPRVQLITLGGGFVAAGETVTPVLQTTREQH
ncbi:efflux RND transporter periplasmic adaptor subunit [Marinospirillum alkaliphilum]|uniref:Membrane fusion protein, multidrug efflux system n=1 Tax=Marinospirillum alkaliphilum DSM 21637 TaxID=1122209 RepID=A0A1K1V188_9GAMM|nr:efflux RND transporter periplasmic adaptor subunit [Marinospirillum alkaliphilum]SFX18555.1 membrane fusion protein, multidrug efflux system [Marinospirillum alkaliphilum DSM 21637]